MDFLNLFKKKQEKTEEVKVEDNVILEEKEIDTLSLGWYWSKNKQELQMAKIRAKAALIRGLGDNSSLAQQLSYYQTRFGDWRELFHQVKRIESVRKEDVRRVANAAFVASNRTVGIIESTPPAGAAIQ